MSVATIANRYARALADVITERHEVADVVGELSTFAQLLEQHAELREVFASPVIPLDRKRRVLDELLQRLQARQTTNNFLQLLLENQRLHHLSEMLRSLARELDTRTGIVSAEVTTARALSEADRAALRDRLRAATGKEVRLHFRTDPAIIGGVVTRIDSLIFDGSIKTQLAQMKQRLSQG
jgi:F-type H+-transporting ATPase subunit delta